MSFTERVQKLLSQLGPFIALIIIIIIFNRADNYFGDGNFLTVKNFRKISNSAALIAVPAMGMTLIIIAGGIDLSAGTALTLCGTVLALVMKNSTVVNGDPGFTLMMLQAVSLAMLTGCLCGLINGALISLSRVVPFIVTLGTMTIFLGVGQILANESTVYADLEKFPGWLRHLCYTGKVDDNYLSFFGFHPNIPTSVLIMIVLTILVSLFLKYTVMGRKFFAIGSSESTARLCGINVPVTNALIYTIAGIFVAIGGIMYFANVKNGNPKDGMGMELQIIAAVVLGGGSLSGGRGSVIGTVVGAFIITVIRNGCGLLSIPNTYTHIIIGCIIILAVIIDQLRHGSPEWFFRLIRKKSSG
ncbi:MAG: ABC transporter permease [Planctomycetota bacterium]